MEERTLQNEILTTDYEMNYVKKVHRIGRFTLTTALFLSVLPLIYFMFVKGYRYDSISPYIAYVAMVWPMAATNYFSEPLSYWPFVGSAGIYMSYLAGSCMNIRVPVGVSALNATNSTVDSPKGQVVTTLSIAVSVVSNIVILFLIIVFGDQLLALLPDIVKASFAFITLGLNAYTMALLLSANPTGNVLITIPHEAIYIVTGIGVFYLVKYTGIPSVWGPLLTMAICLSISLIKNKRETTKNIDGNP